MTRTAAVLAALAEDADGHATDEVIALELRLSRETVAVIRRKAGIPGAYARRRAALKVRSRLARCGRCMRDYRLPQDRGHYGSSMACPRCGDRIRYSGVSLE